MPRPAPTALLALLWLGPAAAPAQETDDPALTRAPQPGRYRLATRSGGFDRVAHVQVPRGYRPGSTPPLVVFFHGAGGDGRRALDQDRWAAKADKEGFLVLAPTGLPARPRQPADFLTNPRVWNSGQLNPLSPRAAINDVTYTAALLDALYELVPYDRTRVFAAGHSNGAGMTFRLGAELPERFAALAPVAGMLGVKEPHPSKPLPTLYIIGTKDPLQPLEGGKVTLPWASRTNPPVSTYLTGWARALGCAPEPQTLSDRDGLKTVEYRPKSAGGPALRVIYIEGQGHTWPGGRVTLPPRTVGPVTQRLDATDTIWEFFRSVAPPRP